MAPSLLYDRRVWKMIFNLRRMEPGQTSPELSAASLWFTPGRFALILAGAILAAFPKVVLGLESFVYRDYGVLGYPFMFHFHESFWRGELPLWNPLSNCGAPFMAQWGTMVCYPLSLFHLLLPLPVSLGWFTLGHLFLGGLGMYALARHWTDHPLAASVAGLAFVFNGVTFSSLIWPNYMVAQGWMPWVILTTEIGLMRGGRWVCAASILAAMQLLSGVPETVLLTWLVIGALTVRQLMRDPAGRQAAIARCGTVVVVAAGFAAVQLLPFLDLLAHSQRDANFSSSKWPMPGWGWANLLVPLFRCFQTPQGPFFQYGQQFFTSYYPGAGLLVLSVWIALVRRESRVWILAGAVLLALVMALGENGYIFVLFKKLVPLASVARYPVKFMALAAFAIPLLAAYAVQELDAGSRQKHPLLLAGTGAALALMAVIVWFAHAYPYSEVYDQPAATLKNAIGRAVFLIVPVLVLSTLGSEWVRKIPLAVRGLLLLLIPLDIMTHVPNQNPTVDKSAFQPGFWQASNQLAPPETGVSRVFITPAAEALLLKSRVEDLQQDYIGKRLALWSNLNLIDQLPKINGSSTLQLREQAVVQKAIYDRTNSIPEGLVNFLGGIVQSSPSNPTEWIPRTNSLPLITAGQQPVFTDDPDTLDALLSDDFDPARTVYLPPDSRESIQVSEAVACRILETTFTPHRITIEVEAAGPSMVVVAQSFYHPWKARVDGEPAKLFRANYAFQSLQVPAGRHSVVVAYEDRRFAAGGVISLVTLLVTVGYLWRSRRAEQS